MAASFFSLTGQHAFANLFVLALVLLSAGTLVPLLFVRFSRLAHATGAFCAAAGCLTGFAASLPALGMETPISYVVPWQTAGINLCFAIDGLAAFFLAPLFLVGLAAALYGYSYLDVSVGRRTGLHWFFHNLLLLSMAMVITAANGLQFLIAWESMSISSFFLVLYHGDEPARKAGWLYLIATHIGVAFLFLFFLVAGLWCGGLDFTSFALLKNLTPAATALLFLLALVGFGSKAGLFPMHVWLPAAHPAAPSHVSALMSAVMVKTALYGLLRAITLLPPLPSWCGIVLVLLGLAGSLFGIAMASLQEDIKKSLAYSTVENIGLICTGLGLWLFGIATGRPVLAALALTGALLHIWNHALFKGLLFLAAGSIYHATGSRLFASYGGLLRRMPATGLLLVLGSAAIAGLPPLNGFVSEFYLYMSAVLMGQQASGLTALFLLLVLALMVLTGTLVLLAVSRMCGIALLGEPRREIAATAHEAPASMLLGMILLLAGCLLTGILPVLPLAGVKPALAALGAANGEADGLLSVFRQTGWSAGGAMVLAIALFFLLRQAGRRAATPATVTWSCGFQKPTCKMVYTGGGFSQLARDTMFRSCCSQAEAAPLTAGFFGRTATFVRQSVDPVLHRFFLPFFYSLANGASTCRLLQSGRMNVYLFYIFSTTILLLGWAFFQLT